MLVLAREAGEGLVLTVGGERILVKVVQFRKRGGRWRVQIGVEASGAVRVLRDELLVPGEGVEVGDG